MYCIAVNNDGLPVALQCHNTGIISVLDFDNSSECAVVSYCFNLLFLSDLRILNIFSCLPSVNIHIFGEVFVQAFCPFSNQIAYFLTVYF
jgi:hypothetical protein